MIDTSTPRGKLVDAALRLAAERKWSDVTLLDVAEAAQMPLAEVRKVAGSKSQIVAAFMRTIDDGVLERATARAKDQPMRDTLFDVIMSRFDALMPHKAALRSIHAAGPTDTSLIMPFLNSQRWMLTAAGADPDGLGGFVRTIGLGSVYASVFATWIDDEDPGMARTMAALDRRLRSGERTLSTIEGTVGGLARIATDLPGVLRSVIRGRRPPVAPAGDDRPV
jgi:AcrR family transcriptional regulator